MHRSPRRVSRTEKQATKAIKINIHDTTHTREDSVVGDSNAKPLVCDVARPREMLREPALTGAASGSRRGDEEEMEGSRMGRLNETGSRGE
jgi:hypothetical protein